MNKKAYMLGYMRASENISKVAFEQAYMEKFAGGSNWNPANWKSNLEEWGKEQIKSKATSLFNWGTKNLVDPYLQKKQKEMMSGLKENMMPIAFGGLGLMGLGSMFMGGGGGGGNQQMMDEFKSTMQSVNGDKTNPYGLPTQQGYAGTFDPDKWVK